MVEADPQSVTVRDAVEADVPAITAIFNRAVETLTATWALEPDSLERRTEWFRTTKEAGYPVLVVELQGEVVGFAALGPFRTRGGYRFTCENSVYVAEGHRRAGIGKALMTELMVRAKQGPWHTVVAFIDTGEPASVRLHKSVGFEVVGGLREAGRKFDRWLDEVLMQKMLREEGVDG